MHTPGPWTATRETDDDGEEMTYVGTVEKRGVDGNDYRLGNARRHVCKVYDWNGEADTRLIAAAPDMLEACRAALTALYGMSGMYECEPTVQAKLRAAIAKAEGRTP